MREINKINNNIKNFKKIYIYNKHPKYYYTNELNRDSSFIRNVIFLIE